MNITSEPSPQRAWWDTPTTDTDTDTPLSLSLSLSRRPRGTVLARILTTWAHNPTTIPTSVITSITGRVITAGEAGWVGQCYLTVHLDTPYPAYIETLYRHNTGWVAPRLCVNEATDPTGATVLEKVPWSVLRHDQQTWQDAVNEHETTLTTFLNTIHRLGDGAPLATLLDRYLTDPTSDIPFRHTYTTTPAVTIVEDDA